MDLLLPHRGGPEFVFLDLLTRLHHILDDMLLVVYHTRVPKVVRHSSGAGRVMLMPQADWPWDAS
jgi:hypothetical protein